MDWWKVSVLPFSVVVDEAWNGKCSRQNLATVAKDEGCRQRISTKIVRKTNFGM